jgi:hypothetical protein
MEKTQTLSDEIMNDGLGYNGLVGVKPLKKHLQEFQEELKNERKEHTHYDIVNKNKDFHTLHDDCYLCLFNRLIDKILNTQMLKHFGDKLI